MTAPFVKLGDVIDVLSGFAFKSEFFNDSDGLPVVRIRDVVRGYTDTYYTGPYTEQFVVRDGDILIGMDGNFNAAKWRGGRALLNQRVCKVAARASLLEEAYLFHYLPIVLRRIEDATPFVTVKHLSAGDLREERIPLPPLPEQRRIAAILDKADALRTKRREALAQLDRLPQSIFVEMFGDPRRNPKAWPAACLLDVCSPKQWPTISSTDLTTEGYPVYGANGVIGRYGTFNHEEATVLITCRGATCGTINVCEPKSYVTGNSMALDNPNPELLRIDFLEWVLRVRGVAESISGSAQPQITREKLAVVSIPLPPIPLQEMFARRVSAVRAVRSRLLEGGLRADSLFAALQTQAFGGKL